MPYSSLDGTINDLSGQRVFITVLSCVSILIILTLIFLRYFFMTRSQLRELMSPVRRHLRQAELKVNF